MALSAVNEKYFNSLFSKKGNNNFLLLDKDIYEVYDVISKLSQRLKIFDICLFNLNSFTNRRLNNKDSDLNVLLFYTFRGKIYIYYNSYEQIKHSSLHRPRMADDNLPQCLLLISKILSRLSGRVVYINKINKKIIVMMEKNIDYVMAE